MNRFQRSLYLLIFIIIPAVISAKDGYPRNTHIDVIHYGFSLSLNDSTDRIEGRSTILVKYLAHTDSLSFDLSNQGRDGKGMIVTNVTISGKTVAWNHRHDKLTFFSGKADNDTVEISVFYKGIPADGLIISKN
ncbi:MAG: hypothetical protein ACM3UT_01115, partial [Chloroflexota bacterium]